MRSAAQPFSGVFQDRAAASSKRELRADIQGLRAISVLAVVLAHAKLPGFAGGFVGVDVFFVISGFLITRLLLAEIAATGRIDLKRFWVKRALRLLPNALTTLAVTALLAALVFPGYDLRQLAEEITLAALEVVNFHFASTATDYFRYDGLPSPVLHFWSLNVEEQFYFVWPVILLALALRFKTRPITAAAAFLITLWLVSFAASLFVVGTDQPRAYFHTEMRCWQLASGALLAAFSARTVTWPRMFRQLLAWAGFAAVLLSIVFFDEAMTYPGIWALVPTLGTVAVLAGRLETGHSDDPLQQFLSLPALQWIGARSYSWYLWHWPLLVLPQAAYADTPLLGVVSLGLSLIVASAAYSWVEEPVRRGNLRYTGAPRTVFVAAVASVGAAIAVGHLAIFAPALFNSEAAARYEQLEKIARDAPPIYRDGCHLERRETRQPDCVYGDAAASRTVVLFGDSHAAQWFSPLAEAAKTTGWLLKSWTKSACVAVDIHVYDKQAKNSYPECQAWREEIMNTLLHHEKPRAVIISNNVDLRNKISDATKHGFHEGENTVDAWQDAFRRTVEKLTNAGIKVIVIRDTPTVRRHFKTCIAYDRLCDKSREEAFADPSPEFEVASEFGNTSALLDLSNHICNSDKCLTVKSNILVYRDHHHISNAFASTLTPAFTRLLATLKTDIALPSILVSPPLR